MESIAPPPTLLYSDIHKLLRILKNTVIWTVTGALQLKLSSPACLFAARTATHPPTCLVHCYLASRVYNDQTIFIITQNTQDLIEGNNNLYNIWIIWFVEIWRRSVFLSVYFICLTREHLFMQTNKLKEILVLEFSITEENKQVCKPWAIVVLVSYIPSSASVSISESSSVVPWNLPFCSRPWWEYLCSG